jgi:stress response protein YsnF
MSNDKEEIIVPVIAEQLNVDAVPVLKGGVRVVKHTVGQEHLVEQELRRDHIEVKRVKVHRIVEGPQEAIQSGNTTIIPVVEEVLRIERQWVVTEEIHLIRTEETSTFRDKVIVNREEATVERFNASRQASASDPDEK